MSADRPNIEFPGIEGNLGTEYGPGHSWKFDNKDLHPAFQQASQSLKNFFLGGEEWRLEAYRITVSPVLSLSPSMHFYGGYEFVFYSPAREKGSFTKKELTIDFNGILRSKIPRKEPTSSEWWDNRGHELNIPAIDIPPLSPIAKPDNPINPYLVSDIVFRGFKIYLDYKLHPDGSISYKGLDVVDPRRVVVFVGLVNPVAGLIIRIGQQDQWYQKERRYLLRQQNKLPKEVWVEAMVGLEKAERAYKSSLQGINDVESTTRIFS